MRFPSITCSTTLPPKEYRYMPFIICIKNTVLLVPFCKHHRKRACTCQLKVCLIRSNLFCKSRLILKGFPCFQIIIVKSGICHGDQMLSKYCKAADRSSFLIFTDNASVIQTDFTSAVPKSLIMTVLLCVNLASVTYPLESSLLISIF